MSTRVNGERAHLLAEQPRAESATLAIQQNGGHRYWGFGALLNGAATIIAGGGVLYFLSKEGGFENAKICGAIAAVTIANAAYYSFGWNRTSVIEIPRDQLQGVEGLVDITVLSQLQGKSVDQITTAINQITGGVETQVRSLLRQIYDKPVLLNIQLLPLAERIFKTDHTNPMIANKLQELHIALQKLDLCQTAYTRQETLKIAFSDAIDLMQEILPNFVPSKPLEQIFNDPDYNKKYHILTSMVDTLNLHSLEDGSKISGLETQLQKANERLEAMEGKEGGLARALSKIVRLEEQIASLERELGEARERALKDADDKLSKATARITELQLKLATAKEKKETFYTKTYEPLWKEYDEMGRTLETCQTTLASKDQEMQAVYTTISTVVGALNNLADAISRKNSDPVVAFSDKDIPERTDDLIDAVNRLIIGFNSKYTPGQATPTSRNATPASSPSVKTATSALTRRITATLERRNSAIRLKKNKNPALSDEEE